MQRVTLFTTTALVLASLVLTAPAVADPDWAASVDVWTETVGDDGVYYDGDTVYTYVRPNRDGYVVVYGADAHGVIHLLYPFDDTSPRRLNAGDIIELDGPFFEIGNDDGVVYVEALVSDYPIEPRLPAYLYDSRRVRDRHRWDYAGVRVSPYGVIIGDPHLALAEFRTGLVPVGCAPYARAHATFSFRVEHRRHYPRYVCADCHLGSWYDPYRDSCSVFEIRIDGLWADSRYWDRCEPRYYYRKRPFVPYRYRSVKNRWSSKDGCDLLGRTFAVKSPRERSHLRDKGYDDIVDRVRVDKSSRADVRSKGRGRPSVRDRDDGASSSKSLVRPDRKDDRAPSTKGRDRIDDRKRPSRDADGRVKKKKTSPKDKPRLERKRERPRGDERKRRDVDRPTSKRRDKEVDRPSKKRDSRERDRRSDRSKKVGKKKKGSKKKEPKSDRRERRPRS